MSEDMKIIYKILKTLQRSMDFEEFDSRTISAETLGITKARWNKIMLMLVESGYIKGVDVVEIDNMPMPYITVEYPRITLKGIEYLEENSMMKKASNIAKGIIDAVV